MRQPPAASAPSRVGPDTRRPRRNAADRILHAAATRLSTLGAAELSLQDVATAAGVSKALIHYHYKDKESLLEQVAVWATAASVERERQALTDSTAADAVDALWRWLEGELRGGHLRLLMELGQYRAPRVQTAVADALQVRRDASLQTIRRLFELLELRPRVPVELLAGVVVAFIDGLASRPDSGAAEDVRVTFDVFWLSLLSLAE